MSAEEFLLFIPLLIYGIVLSRLLGEWRHFFDLASLHWPYVITIVVFTEISIWNTYTFLDIFRGHSDASYTTYLSILVAPFLLLLAVDALVRDGAASSVDRGEFQRRLRPGYLLMGSFIALHLLPGYRADDGELLVRLPALATVWAIAWLRKDWLIYLLGVIWVASLVRRVQLGL